MIATRNVKLRTVIFEQGMTQRNLAFATHIDEARLSKIIRGYEKPTPEMAQAIADFLKKPIEELFPTQ